MQKIVIILISLLFGAGVLNAEPLVPKPQTGDLRKTLSGRVVYLSTPIGMELPIRYNANGTMRAKSSAHLASMAGEDKTTDYGRWWVTNGRLCQRWQNWLNRQAYCYDMTINGRSVNWRRNDGRSGTARLGS